MGSTEREDAVPPPPPYEARASIRPQFQPPPGPPPSLPAAPFTEASAASSSSSSAQVLPNGIELGLPSLASAPPVYEPFSFSDAYSRSHWARAPKWHTPPSYNLYHDRQNSSISFHIALPDTEPPCACANEPHCECSRRPPAVWRATMSSNSRSASSSKKTIGLWRISPFSDTQQVSFTATNDKLLGSSSTLTIRNDVGKTYTQMKKKGDVWSYKDLQGKTVYWQKKPRRLELLNPDGLPMAVLHSGTPSRLELTSLAWSRMPSDQIECDYPDCPLQPLFGFVFRCQDCTEQGKDSFDICEPHLADECRKHDQTHHFIRQPRPFADFDDCVQETPLLDSKDMQMERRVHELMIMTLSCVLLDV